MRTQLQFVPRRQGLLKEDEGIGRGVRGPGQPQGSGNSQKVGGVLVKVFDHLGC